MICKRPRPSGGAASCLSVENHDLPLRRCQFPVKKEGQFGKNTFDLFVVIGTVRHKNANDQISVIGQTNNPGVIDCMDKT